MSKDGYNAAKAFLQSEGMYYGSYDFGSLVRSFAREMEEGLAGRESSLAMIPTYFSTPRVLPEGEDVAVIDAGGTSLRRGIVRPADRSPVIRGLTETCMPGTVKRISKDRFIQALGEFISPLLVPGRRIGFCFSYPIRNDPDKDARVVSMTKELKISDIIGAYIGRELLSYLESRRNRDVPRIAVCNDTIALFLSGRRQERDLPADEEGGINIGYILGTGINACYQEPNENIHSVRDVPREGKQIINIEAGGFQHIPRGSADEELDKLSVSRNRYTLEKMSSGAYLGPLLYLSLRKGREEGLFSRTSAEKLNDLPELSTKDLSELLENPDGSRVAGFLAGKSDIDTAYNLASMLLQRSSLAAAVPLAAVIERSICFHRNNKKPFKVLVSAEGSTLFRVPGYKERILAYIIDYAKKMGNPEIYIREIKNGSLLGAGIAAVSDV